MSKLHLQHREFLQRLDAFRRRWRLGMLLAAALLLLAALLACLLVYGVADRWLGFGVSMRVILTSLVGIVVLVLGARELWKVFRYSRSNAAREADLAAGSRGRILSALELLHAKSTKDRTPLQDYLVGRSVQAGDAMLGWHQVQEASPKRLILRKTAWCATAAVVGGVVAMMNWDATKVVWQRITHPTQDLPPYSELNFYLTPEDPSVVYGDAQLFQCSIEGGTVEEDVTFLVRDPRTGSIDRAPSFRESGNRFARKLENVTSPVEVAFAVGEARSAWQPVGVRYQPRIVDAMVRIIPPSYTKQVERSFKLGAEEIRAVAGSVIEARLTSNRPLSGGEVKIAPLGSEKVELLMGEASADREALFRWTLRQSAALEFVLEDLQGTRSPQPLQVGQLAIPDQAPAVHIVSPQPYALATSRTKLPFLAEAIDDFGLAKVDLVRAVVGYRDRSQSLVRGEVGLRYDLEQPLDLGSLGVTPGQTLEFMMEATDGNPSLMGVGTSEVVRVHIISDEDYGARIRLSTALAEFGDRFSVLGRSVEEARQATQEAVEADRKGDVAARNEALKKADAAHAKAESVAKALAEDFQAYAMDRALAKSAQEIAQGMAENRADLESLAGGGADIQKTLKGMMDRLGGMREKAQEQKQKSDEVMSMAKILEMAVKYRELLANQESIVRRMQTLLKEILEGAKANQAALEALGATQKANAEELEAFGAELKKRAAELPPAMAEIASQSQAFANALEQLNIPEAMGRASEAAKDARISDALLSAELALKLMKQLLEDQDKKKNAFAGACKGKSPGTGQGQGQGGAPDTQATLQQMLESMLAQMQQKQGQGQGNQPGQGQGTGPGGFGEAGSGSWMAGQNLPMFGPSRMRFGNDGGQAMPGGEGRGRGQGRGQAGVTATQRNSVEAEQKAESSSNALKPEMTPEGYREAVKRYFSRKVNSTQSNP